jgi:flotillin
MEHIFILLASLVPVAALGILVFTALNLRRVVPTNAVHIIQRGTHTVSYGKGLPAGNVYYEWPIWFPFIGVTTRVLNTFVFDVVLQGYDAYDMDRVPFVVDVTAFFRISDPNTAAERIDTIEDLEKQLFYIVQGAVRTTLATHDIDEIMTQRAKFGAQFTEEVAEQLKAWGVETVKSMELMDIRDAKGHDVVANIMAKKMSHIQSESRKQVAQNNQAAQEAEIAATRSVQLQQQEAEQQIGERTAAKNQAIGIASEKSKQEVAVQQKVSKEKEMDVLQVQTIRQAEIGKQQAIIAAGQQKETSIISAEAEKQVNVTKAEGTKAQTILQAEGALESAKRQAEAVQLQGEAKGAAETAINLAAITPQITLAKEIGENAGYQDYLVKTKQIEATRDVGLKQAEALNKSDIKIIANASTPSEGLTNVGKLFSANSGFGLGSLLEGFSTTPAGKAVTDVLGITEAEKPTKK